MCSNLLVCTVIVTKNPDERTQNSGYCDEKCPMKRSGAITQRVQVPNIQGLWAPIPLRVWFLEPETSNVGYLDPLSKSWLLQGP